MEKLTEEQFLALTNEEKAKEYAEAYRQHELHLRWYIEEVAKSNELKKEIDSIKCNNELLSDGIKKFADAKSMKEVGKVAKELLSKLLD